MPLYDMKCEMCKGVMEIFCSIADRRGQLCRMCGGPLTIQIASPNLHIFKPEWYEHIDHKPLFIESKKQLREECEKRGLTSVRGHDTDGAYHPLKEF